MDNYYNYYIWSLLFSSRIVMSCQITVLQSACVVLCSQILAHIQAPDQLQEGGDRYTSRNFFSSIRRFELPFRIFLYLDY